MRIDLLIALRDKLRSLPPELFDINQWRSDCGTVACAAGWACTMPEFNKAGLHMVGSRNPSLWQRDPIYGGKPIRYNYEALRTVLEISYRVSIQMFSPGAYYHSGSPVTPSRVANRIQFLITYGEYEFLRLFNEEYLDD